MTAPKQLPPAPDEPKKPVERVPKDHIVFSYKGQSYHAPNNPFDLPGSYIENYLGAPGVPMNKPNALFILLGEKQYAAFKATDPTVRDFTEVFYSYGAMIGAISSGE